MKILAITQARYGSTRLPAKILKAVNGQTLLEIHLRRILQSELISELKVATTREPGAEYILQIAEKLGVKTYQGSIDDVLERFYETAAPEHPDYVVRLTSDSPLVDAKVIDKVLEVLIEGKYDYVSTGLTPTYPDGISIEAFTMTALEKAYREAQLKSEREHVTPYIWKNSTWKGGSLFKSFCVQHDVDYSRFRLTVDEQADYDMIKNLIEKLGTDKEWEDYVDYLITHPEVSQINSIYSRNEGYEKSLKEDKRIK